MRIVIGLGNPGRQYEGTRHNVGWMVLDRIAERAGWTGRGKERDAALVLRGRYEGLDLVLVKPLTYMNDSGTAVRKILARERVPLEQLLVVADDFSLPLGRLRMREEGSAGGHNGLRSIIAEMGTQRFPRLRVGIGEPARGAVDHVLTRFAPDELADLERVIDAAADATIAWASDGVARASNRWNPWTLATTDPRASRHGSAAGDPAMPTADRPSGHDADRPSGRAADRPSGRAAERGPDRDADAAAGSAGAADGRPDRTLGPDGIVRTAHGWRKPLAGHDEGGRR